LPEEHQAWAIKPREGRIAQYLGSACARVQGRVGRGADSLSELEFRVCRRLRQPDASHILYVENHFALLSAWAKPHADVIGTVHLPPSVWNAEQRGLLSRLHRAIVLYHRDVQFFEKQVGGGRVRFVHHGVDTEFFRPDASQLSATPRILYSGVYLRNEAMFTRMVERIAGQDRGVHFDLLVPRHHRNSPALAPLLGHPAVSWHGGLSDDELRALYQRSHLMLLPMNDSGANTAVVEALASGLPIVTTDVGGIRDYGGGAVFPVVPNNDDDGMIALIEQYLSRPAWRGQIGNKCRSFAETNLAWPLIAQKHLDIYKAEP
jgi:glycosyltransferase involved in cell wall biosynthesis